MIVVMFTVSNRFGELRNLSKNDLAPSNFQFDGISLSLNTICGKDLKHVQCIP